MTPGIQVAKPKTAVEGQITLETIPPTNAANIPPHGPKKIPSEGFTKAPAEGPYGMRGIVARTMSNAAKALTSVTSFVGKVFLRDEVIR